MRHRSLTVTAGMAAVLCLLSACSSGPSGPSAAVPAGEPIRLVFISGTGPGTSGELSHPGIEAAEQAVNAAGGVRGRPLEIEFCDTNGDVNRGGACARDAVGDPNVLATVGTNDYRAGTAINPVLAEAGMAAIATKPYTSADYASPVVFPVEGGGMTIHGGMALYMNQRSTNVTALVYSSEGSEQGVGYARDRLRAILGRELTSIVRVPPSTTDVAPFVSEALRTGPETVTVAFSETAAVSAVRQLRAQGFTGTIAGAATTFTREALSNAGEVGDLELVGSYSYDSPGYARFEEEMAAFDDDVAPSDEAVNSWIGVHLFADTMNASTQPLTRQGVLAAIGEVRGYSTSGLTPPIDFSASAGLPDAPRLFNASSVLHEVVDGEIRDVQPPSFLDTVSGEVLEPQT